MSIIYGNSTFGSLFNAIYGDPTTVNTIEPYENQKTFPVVMLSDNYVDPEKASTVVAYSGPNSNILTYAVFNDLNKDKDVVKTITKYYYYKILDKWLYDDFLPILAFVKMENGKPKLISSMAEFRIADLAREPENVIESKIDYLSEIFITKDMVRHVLKKFINKYNTRYSALNRQEHELKKYFFKYMKDKLEEAVEH